jgi:hypothetical protein
MDADNQKLAALQSRQYDLRLPNIRFDTGMDNDGHCRQDNDGMNGIENGRD